MHAPAECVYVRLTACFVWGVVTGRDGGVGSMLLQPQYHVSKTYIVHAAHNTPLKAGGGDGLVPDVKRLIYILIFIYFPTIFPIFLPLFRLYEVVLLHMCVLPYKYRKLFEMLPNLM